MAAIGVTSWEGTNPRDIRRPGNGENPGGPREAAGATGRHSFESLRRMSVAVDALSTRDPAELDDAALADRLVALRELLAHLEAEGQRCRAVLDHRGLAGNGAG